jgi:hypothetical protein
MCYSGVNGVPVLTRYKVVTCERTFRVKFELAEKDAGYLYITKETRVFYKIRARHGERITGKMAAGECNQT